MVVYNFRAELDMVTVSLSLGTNISLLAAVAQCLVKAGLGEQLAREQGRVDDDRVVVLRPARRHFLVAPEGAVVGRHVYAVLALAPRDDRLRGRGGQCRCRAGEKVRPNRHVVINVGHGFGVGGEMI